MCRAEGGLMHCKKCKKAFHAKCAELDKIIENFVCDQCDPESDLRCNGQRDRVKDKDKEKEKGMEKDMDKEKGKNDDLIVNQSPNPSIQSEYTPTKRKKSDDNPDESEIDEEETPLASSSISVPLSPIKSLHTQAMTNRTIFMKSIRPLLKVLCDLQTLNRIAPVSTNPKSSGRRKVGGRAPKRATQDSIVESPSVEIPQCSISETPSYIKNVTLKEYQVEGVNTLCGWFHRGVGGVLGDEM